MQKTVTLLLLLSNLVAYTQEKKSFFFIENKGQWDKEVLFAADLPEGKLYLKKDGISYRIGNTETRDDIHFHGHSHDIRGNLPSKVDLTFKNATTAQVIPSRKHQEKYNYYIGANRSKWAENCHAYDELLFKSVYEGIDLKVYGNQESIKYDWVVAKGADASRINIKYNEDAKVYLENGCAFIGLKSATIMEGIPVSYQKDHNGNRIKVPTSYKLEGNELSYVLSEGYDPSKELIIDPELVFSTFSGSVSNNFGYTACFDDEGNLYSGGIVFGSSFPITTGPGFGGGAIDMGILKYDSTGENLLYGTFIGGSEAESPHSLVVNNAGELLILGTTGSSNYPVTSSAYDNTYNGGDQFELFTIYPEGSDIVVTKLNQNGQLIASTYVGGSENDGILKMVAVNSYLNRLIYNYGDYQRGDIFVDEEDNVYIASNTESSDFPINSTIQPAYSGGNSDAIVFSLNSNLSTLRWSTFLGGAGDDAAHSVKINALGQVAVGGGTTSAGFPTTPSAFIGAYGGDTDGFITVIDIESDTLVTSTFVGTSSYDQIYFIDIDEAQNVYATGQTRGSYPISPGVYANPNSGQFIHKFNAEVDSTIFSTTIGTGNPIPNISPTAFLANECSNLFLSGWGGFVNTNNTSSILASAAGLPTTSDAFQTTSGGSDFYLMVLSADGRDLLYATYFGSSNTGDHVDGGTSRFDKKGIIYQSVCTCGGANDDFPTTENAWSEVNRGNSCNNASFKFDLATLRANFETSFEDGNNVGISSGCLPLSILFTNTSSGGEQFFWDFGNGTTSNTNESVLVTYEDVGEYTVNLTVQDENTCTTIDSISSTISVFDDQINISEDVVICEGSSTQLSVTGGATFDWRPGVGLNSTTISNPTASPPSTVIYEVDVVTPNGCEFTERVRVTVAPIVIEDLRIEPVYSACSGANAFQFFNATVYDGQMTWDFGDGQTSSELDPFHSYQNPGVYSVGLEIDEDCVIEQTLTVESSEIFIPNVFTPNNDMLNDYFEIKTPVPVELVVVNRAGSIVYEERNYSNKWDGGNSPSGTYYYSIRFPNDFICKGWVQIIR